MAPKQKKHSYCFKRVKKFKKEGRLQTLIQLFTILFTVNKCNLVLSSRHVTKEKFWNFVSQFPFQIFSPNLTSKIWPTPTRRFCPAPPPIVQHNPKANKIFREIAAPFFPFNSFLFLNTTPLRNSFDWWTFQWFPISEAENFWNTLKLMISEKSIINSLLNVPCILYSLFVQNAPCVKSPWKVNEKSLRFFWH